MILNRSDREIRKALWVAIRESPFNSSNAFPLVFGPLTQELPPSQPAVSIPHRASQSVIPAPLPSPPAGANQEDSSPIFVFAKDARRKTRLQRKFLPHPVNISASAGPVVPEDRLKVEWILRYPVPEYEFDLENKIVFQPPQRK
jgi:hypothetical protein